MSFYLTFRGDVWMRHKSQLDDIITKKSLQIDDSILCDKCRNRFLEALATTSFANFVRRE
jgi:hypothetical protein